VLVGEYSGEWLAQAPGDLLDRDGERKVGDGDAEILRRSAGNWPRICRMPMATVILKAAPSSMT
jgi:hypothetical protein